MKSLVLLILFIVVFTFKGYSQVEIPVFEKMSGRWQGYSESNGEKYKEYINMGWTLNHNFFEISLSEEQKDKSKENFMLKEIEYITIDGNSNLKGWSIDDYGVTHMLNFYGTFDENTVILNGTNETFKNNINYELKDNQLIRKSEFKTPVTGEAVKAEVTYSSVRSDYNTHFLPTQYDNISGAGLAYVCHLSENFVTVFDTKTNKLIGKIPCGKNSNWVCYSNEINNGYISNFTSGNLTVFNRNTNETISTVDAGENPTFLLPIKNKILISHQSKDGLWVLDVNSNTIIKKLQAGTGPLYYIKNGNKIYQPQIFTPYLFIIDPDKLEIVKTIKVEGRPMEMAFIDNMKFGYLVNFDLNKVEKFNTKKDKVVKEIIDIKHPRGIASSPDGKLVYVSSVTEGKVYVINTETDMVTATIDGFTMPVSIAFTNDGNFAYVLNQRESSISVIDTKLNAIVQTFNVAGNPISITIIN
jgi:YVTN family beta-propeller protein